MASLMQQADRFYCQFVYHGKRQCFALGKVTQDEAEAKVSQVDYVLMRLKQGLLKLPTGMNIVTFLAFDGKPPEETPASREDVTFGVLRDRYLAVHRGSLEDTTVNTLAVHFKHLVAALGAGFPLKELTQETLQAYATRRSKMTYRGKPIRPATIKKELVSLRTAWNWGVGAKLVTGVFPPLRMIRLEKPDEKPPFQTWQEIERRLAVGGLTAEQAGELWDCLFLQLPEVEALLQHVKATATHRWVYPLFCFAAHTGARRSELLRALITDVDFTGGTVLIRERKRAHDRRTTRRVPLTPFLADVLRDWLAAHPGGRHLFCHAGEVGRSKKRSKTTGHKGESTRASSLKGRLAAVTVRERPGSSALTRSEATDHFKRVLAGSRWEVLRGWHVLRHSFASNCAARGIDQRLLDAWLGHTTDIRKRYLHLIPSNEQSAICSVFGGK